MEYSTAALQLWNLNSQKKCVTSPRVRRILAVTRASVSWEEPGLFVSVHEDGAVCFVNRIPMNVKLAPEVSVLRLKVSRVIWNTEMFWFEMFQNLIKSPWGRLTDKIKLKVTERIRAVCSCFWKRTPCEFCHLSCFFCQIKRTNTR